VPIVKPYVTVFDKNEKALNLSVFCAFFILFNPRKFGEKSSIKFEFRHLFSEIGQKSPFGCQV
jgi:hypothetical protein